MPSHNGSTSKSHTRPVTLTVDIGGSGIKALLLDPKGNALSEKVRIPTPRPATPRAVINTIIQLSKALPSFDRVSVGFPGVIQHGRIKTAPNLERSWPGTYLVEQLEKKLGKPVRAANDADIQGYGAIKSQGVEMVITLGTGFGTSLFVDGHLVPNLEIAHHPFQKNRTYEQELGAAALKKIGKRKWSQRLLKAVKILDRVINYDRLFLGGGNAKKITTSLPSNVALVSNMAGLLGGIALWTNGQGLGSTTSPQHHKPAKKAGRRTKRLQAGQPTRQTIRKTG